MAVAASATELSFLFSIQIQTTCSNTFGTAVDLPHGPVQGTVDGTVVDTGDVTGAEVAGAEVTGEVTGDGALVAAEVAD